MKWDLIKVKVRDFSMHYCKSAKNNRNNSIEDLEYKLENIDDNLNRTEHLKTKEHLITVRNELKIALNKELQKRARASQIRSRVEFTEKGEKNNSYFLGLEKHRQTENIIMTLEKADGTFTQTKDEIMSEIESFYARLYTQNVKLSSEPFLSNIDFQNVLDDSKRATLEKPVTVTECRQAIKKLKLNKSPGLDGISSEFYKTFENSTSKVLTDVFNSSFENSSLPNSLTRSVMTLIYKKGDRKLLKNYRPITLTTTDYKILAHIMADRLQNVMPVIINRDQAGYIKGRNIGNNIRIVEDLIHYAKLNNTDCTFCAVDFEKAFDSLSWEFMLNIMKKYNFGPNCIKWISVLYTNPTIQIKNNGWM